MKQFAYCGECGDKTVHVKNELSLKSTWKCTECGFFNIVRPFNFLIGSRS